MKKERLEMFFDAVLAIIMTLLVLDLKDPPLPSFEGLWMLREHYMVYALSFFWCGTMWVNMYRQWHSVKRVNGNVLWMAVVVLFFSSFVPYVTDYAGQHFNNSFAQGLYAFVILMVSVFRLFMNRIIAKINKDNFVVTQAYPTIERWGIIDVALKLLGMILAIFIWPPVSMVMIVIATSLYSWTVTRMENKFDHMDIKE